MRVYWNPKQKQFFQKIQPYKMFLGGRGSGKTTVEGFQQYQNMAAMPRSKGFLAAATYATLLNTTLPAMTKMWEQFGMEEGEDFVIGCTPPKHFEKSFDEPRKYQNVLSWANGRRVILFSMDRPDLNRGGSFTDGALDEAALVPHEAVTRVLIPSIRGYAREFPKQHLRGQFRAYTSIPWKPSGYWTLDYEAKAKSDPDLYWFTEASAEDNIYAIGGPETLRRWQAEMPYMEYLVEVMNQRVRKATDAFYHRFDPDRHGYAMQNLYDESKHGIQLAATKDPNYNEDELLEISFDFSGYFNCATIWQVRKKKEGSVYKRVAYCIHQFFVKVDEGKVAELVDKIVAHYGSHKVKLARLWGEPRGHDPKPDTPKTLFQQIKERFQSHGWATEIKVQNIQVRSHKERGELMNKIFSEGDETMPIIRINETYCKDVIIAMQVTGTKEDGSKDKTNEKNRLFPQEHAPHFTDTLDYFITQFFRPSFAMTRGPLSAVIH